MEGIKAIEVIGGSVCAPKGFSAGGIHCGLRKNATKKDLALIVSSVVANAAAVYTTNKVVGAPIILCKRHLCNERAQAILCNSGNANTCTANGVQIAEQMCECAAKDLSISPSDIIVSSTGVIGVPLALDPIASQMSNLVEDLSSTVEGARDAANAIMTTDSQPKEMAVRFMLGDKICHIGGIAKGSGMIHPNMATMLAFLTTDVSICPELLKKALKSVVDDTFHMISVDGDTSTNDMAAILANGLGENTEIKETGFDYHHFVEALKTVCLPLAKMIAQDGEGASKLISCTVSGASSDLDAKKLAKAVICSNLVKAAMFGADANWGRILCALGYADCEFEKEQVSLKLRSATGEIMVCENGNGINFSESDAKYILRQNEVDILVYLTQGAFSATAYGCDLTYDYVKINGDYRS